MDDNAAALITAVAALITAVSFLLQIINKILKKTNKPIQESIFRVTLSLVVYMLWIYIFATLIKNYTSDIGAFIFWVSLFSWIVISIFWEVVLYLKIKECKGKPEEAKTSNTGSSMMASESEAKK